MNRDKLKRRCSGAGRLRWGPAAALVVCLAACADKALIPAPLIAAPVPAAPVTTVAGGAAVPTLRTEALPTPLAAAQPPARRPARPGAPLGAASAPAAADPGPATLNLEQVSLGTFAQLVYADLLKKNVNIAPEVLSRRDVVTFRSGATQSAAQIEAAAALLLKSYGVAAIDLDGLVRIVPDNASLGNLPEIRRGAALPDTPLPLRPMFHLVELQSVRTTDVTNWLRTMFGERVRAQEDAPRNALLISGTPDNVRAGLEAIRILDQPVMAGGKSVALNPLYLSSDDLARRLIEVLTAQGYAVQPQTSQATGIRYPIVVLPVASLNTVYVFARGDEVVNHILALAKSLDRPNERGVGRNFFTYAVKHKAADSLADTLGQFLGGAARPATPAAAPAAGGAAPAATAVRTGVVVDRSTNTLIFQANPDEYSQIMSLLQTLDRPSRAALIEVTVAELSVDDKSQLGIEFAFTDGPDNGGRGAGGTLGGLGLGAGGFNYRIFNNAGGVRVALNALASANKATILSSPRVMARNGESATIQVGQEVPFVTSQQSTNTSTTTNPQVLQTIQYRNTGVILKVKPVVHSSDQIDLDVTQEVSFALERVTGPVASPTFSTRKVDTKLSLRNGATVMLGGLISEDSTRGDSGIPFLKDIPGVGNLFSNQTGNSNRRELIVLITPYLINDSHDAEALTDAFRRTLGPWAATPATAPASAPLVAPAAASAPASAPATKP